MAPLMTCGPMWPMLTMWPSGAARTTRPTPMLPPAPVTFSTTTVCPRLFVIRSAMMRAIVSVGPPAENGTTIATGRAGKLCADAAPQQETTATTKSRNRFMAPPLRNMVTLRSPLGVLIARRARDRVVRVQHVERTPPAVFGVAPDVAGSAPEVKAVLGARIHHELERRAAGTRRRFDGAHALHDAAVVVAVGLALEHERRDPHPRGNALRVGDEGGRRVPGDH